MDYTTHDLITCARALECICSSRFSARVRAHARDICRVPAVGHPTAGGVNHIVERELHSSNAATPIEVKPEGRVTLQKDAHTQKSSRW